MIAVLNYGFRGFRNFGTDKGDDMKANLRANIADYRLSFRGKKEEQIFNGDQIIEFNYRHKAALDNYDLGAAFKLALDHERVRTGIFYQVERPTMEEKLAFQREETAKRRPHTLRALFQEFA